MSETFKSSNGITIDDDFWKSIKDREPTEEELFAIREWKNDANAQELVMMYPPQKKDSGNDEKKTNRNSGRSEKKEAARKKSLGELGELFAIKVLVDEEYDRIRNLNDVQMNEAFADIYCEKGDQKLVISVKARNKYQKDGKLNSRYNLGTNAYEKARRVAEKYDAEPYWMAIQFDNHEYSIFFGSLEELGGSKAIPVDKCAKGEVGQILVDCKRHYFDFDFYRNA